jgi:hypothetical protein
MAKAASEDTATWDALEDALARLGEIFASPDYAWEWLFKRVADERVRHRAADETPPGFWSKSREQYSRAGSDVSKPEVARGPGAALLDTVTLRGVRVAREDVARYCPQYGAASVPAPSPSEPAPPEPGLSLRPRAAELRALPLRQQIFWAIVNRRYPGDETLARVAPATVETQARLDWVAARDELFPGCAEGAPSYKTVRDWLYRYRELDLFR